jgi:hypothetical protein
LYVCSVVEDSEVELAAHVALDQPCLSNQTDQKSADFKVASCDLLIEDSFRGVSSSSSSSAASVVEAEALVAESQDSVIKAPSDTWVSHDIYLTFKS